jgi:hypothetical protein
MSWHIGGNILAFAWIYCRKAHKISAQLVSPVGVENGIRQNANP